MAAIVSIQLAVPVGHSAGDYCKLHSNGGAGDMDWDSPVSARQIPLFPGGAGIFGWRHGPWRKFPWRHGFSMRCAGWRHLPWRHFPWHYGTAIVTSTNRVTDCGDYLYAFAAYDQAGNPHQGTPDEAAVYIHIAPAKPAALKKGTYNKDTDVLMLEVA